MIGDLVLEARAITFNYRADEPIVSDWSETFRSGEVVALTGESGRGKSTLLYMLGLMLKPQHGEILVDGAEVAGLGDRRRARLRADVFGFVFQDAALDPSRTVLDNVIETALYRGIPRRNVVADARDLLDQFGVSLRAEHKPGQISGGQAQRIALCRALVNEPRILLADEPTGNLDRGSASAVIDAFHRRAHAGATVIVATHDRALVEQCTRYIQL